MSGATQATDDFQLTQMPLNTLSCFRRNGKGNNILTVFHKGLVLSQLPPLLQEVYWDPGKGAKDNFLMRKVVIGTLWHISPFNPVLKELAKQHPGQQPRRSWLLVQQRV